MIKLRGLGVGRNSEFSAKPEAKTVRSSITGSCALQRQRHQLLLLLRLHLLLLLPPLLVVEPR